MGDKNKTMWLVGLVVLIIVVGLAATKNKGKKTLQPSVTTDTTMDKEAPADSSVAVSNQAAASALRIDSAMFAKPGYVVIHEQKDGKPGPVIGHSNMYKPGTYNDISVTLDRQSILGETLYAMLHDDDGNSEYVFPGEDTPTVNDAGDVVVMPLDIQ